MNIVEILQKYLKKYKNILELGSKKGEDLELLNSYYEVTASEDEKVKTRYLKDKYLDIRVILLDIIDIDTHKKFDCIYSKNLLDSLTLEELESSFINQKKVLNNDGIVFHIFNKEKNAKEKIESIISKSFKILESKVLEKNFYIVAKMI